MIPKNSESMQDVIIRKQPTFTYRMDTENRIIQGYTDGKPAMEQAIYKILNTERYHNVIYSWNYGVELANLFGKPVSYAIAELPRRITEALLQDDRIHEVGEFVFSRKRGIVAISFLAKTTQGEIAVEKEVRI